MKTVRLARMRVTAELFAQAPALLSLSEVEEWTGLNRHIIRELALAGDLETWQAPMVRTGHRRAYVKYRKYSVGKLMGFC